MAYADDRPQVLDSSFAPQPAKAVALVATLFWLTTAGTAAAQTLATTTPAPTEGLAEVVVTAEKRTENLQAVPASITAFSAEDLAERGITSVASLASGDVPSVRVVPYAGNQTVLEIGMRGFVNGNGNDITNENQVPSYIDDVYYGRFIALDLELNDLERMEILRGPQGTLFGKNAEGGALRLVSKEPTGEWGVDTRFEGGNFGYEKGVAHINLPAVAGVAAKIDVIGTSDNGWTTNPDPQYHNYGVTEAAGGKLGLLFKPMEAFSAEYAGDYTKLRSTEAWNQLLAYGAPGAPNALEGVWPIQTTTPLSEPYATFRPLDSQEYYGHRLNLDFSPNESLHLKSITAYRRDEAIEYNTSQASSVLPASVFGLGAANLLTGVTPIYDIHHEQFSEELQLSGKQPHLDWVAGGFYLHESGTQTEATYFATLLENAEPGLHPTGSEVLNPPLRVSAPIGADVTSNSSAAFGQLTWRVPATEDQLSLTTGLRVSHDEKSATRPSNFVWLQVTPVVPPAQVAPGGLPCPQSPACSPSISETKVTPMAAIAYDWTPDVSTYFRYSTGYQAPGLSVGSQTFRFVAASTVDSYEVGLKSELDERKLRFNMAAFYLDWENPQFGIQTTSSSTVEFFSGPTRKIYGTEIDTAYAPIPALRFEGALTLLHGTQPPVSNPFAAVLGAGAVSASFHIQDLPDWAASIAATYDLAHTHYGVWRLSVQDNGTASYYSNSNVGQAIASYWLLDGRFALAEIPLGSDQSRLEIAVWGKNLTNKSYNTFLYQVPGPATFSPFGMPRSYGVSAEYRFR